ncbi:UNVERIFIED_CONTAM: hypothetical protein GTU68_041340 [Idotea baltica]|nr:hypothetical protein [Idotea baltica]
MFGVSFPEIFFVLVIALIVFGPEKLPEFAKTLGKFMGQLKNHTDGARKEFYNAIYKPAEELKNEVNSIKSDLKTSKEAIKENIKEDIFKISDDKNE